MRGGGNCIAFCILLLRSPPSTTLASTAESTLPGNTIRMSITNTLSESDIIADELSAIRERRGKRSLDSPVNSDPPAEPTPLKKRLVGLALSGGGIRSAVFSLGVMQRLARDGYLERIDYLSTVSGGGYIGGSLTWLLSADARQRREDNQHLPFDLGPTRFPYGVDDPCHGTRRDLQPAILRHLRSNGKYLTPGSGITLASVVAVLLRGLFLNLFVWLPLVTAAFYLLVRLWPAGFSVALGVSAFMGIVFALTSIMYSISTHKQLANHRAQQERSRASYRHRRRFEIWVRYLLIFGALSLVLGSLPFVETWLAQYVEKTGVTSLALGILGGLLSFFRSRSNDKKQTLLGVVAPVASLLLLYGFVLLSYELAVFFSEFDRAGIGWLFLLAAATSLYTGWCVNLNYISLHRYYRDRIMEAFMPDPNISADDSDGAELANGANLARISHSNKVAPASGDCIS